MLAIAAANNPLPMLAEFKNPAANIIFAAIALIIGLGLSILLARLTKKLFMLAGKSKIIDARRLKTFAGVLSAIVRVIIVFLAVMQALAILGFQMVVTSLAATIGVGTIVITISMQSLFRDVMAGLFMLLENELSVGDYVAIGGLSGRVEKFNLRVTVIRADTGE
jgi:small conductance mechanosensitive channel